MNFEPTEGAIALIMDGKQGTLMFVDFAAQRSIPGQHYDVVEGKYDGQDAQGKPLQFTYRIHVFMNKAMPHEVVEKQIRAFVNQYGSVFEFKPANEARSKRV